MSGLSCLTVFGRRKSVSRLAVYFTCRSATGGCKFSITTNGLYIGQKCVLISYTVRMIEIAHFSVRILLLHHYKSDLAHLSDLYSLVIGLYKSQM